MNNSSPISYDITEPTVQEYISQIIEFFDTRYIKHTRPKYIIREIIPNQSSTIQVKIREYRVNDLRFYTELDGEILCSKYTGEYDDMRIINMIHRDSVVSIFYNLSEKRVVITLDCGYLEVYY